MLTRNDTYRTPAGRRRGLLARLCPVPRIHFYLPVLGIVYRASRLASAGRYDDRAWVASSLAILETMEDSGMQVALEGLTHLRNLGGAAVFIGNHMSTLETFLLPAIICPLRPVTFIVKQSLLTYPVFGSVMRSRNPISVGRENPRADLATVFREGQERLGRGISVVVFPQTTRSPRFDPTQFNSIGVKLALKAGAPIVPLALKTDAWGNGRWLKDFGPVRPSRPVHFRFGEPFRAEGKGAGAHERVVSFVRDSLGEWSGIGGA